LERTQQIGLRFSRNIAKENIDISKSQEFKRKKKNSKLESKSKASSKHSLDNQGIV
jgi:hypothetical protein